MVVVKGCGGGGGHLSGIGVVHATRLKPGLWEVKSGEHVVFVLEYV
jgi:hypothetical protein